MRHGRYQFTFGSGKRRPRETTTSGQRRKIFRSKVVWLYFKRTLVPEGYYLDHKDLDKTNDHPTNLQLTSKKDSHRQGYGIQQDLQLTKAHEFFLYLQFMGQAPPNDHWTLK